MKVLQLTKLVTVEPRGHQRKPSAGTICGKIKLSISYRVDTLYVLVQHIENLTCADSASVISIKS